MTVRVRRTAHRGAPLLMLFLLLGAWSGARAVMITDLLPAAPGFAATTAADTELTPPLMSVAMLSEEQPPSASYVWEPALPPDPLPIAAPRYRTRAGASIVSRLPRGRAIAAPAYVATAGPMPSLPPGTAAAAPAAPPTRMASAPKSAVALASASEPASAPRTAPFLPPTAPARPARRRLSVDGWAFWRQGSDAAPISQGRVPIYGASQVGGVLQYRLAPQSGQDPRLYARAYRALVTNGESELALGGSVRPLARVPIRVAVEGRYTDALFGTEVRPAAYAVTEFAPIRLPYDTRLEAYAQGGWVGGDAATAFADGQMSLLREFGGVGRATNDAVRLMFGAGAWGGAQEGAERVDIGPTLRADFRLGRIPARISVDWRQRVAGDASPGSGVAATLSTGF
jgi:hypothetical protein